MKANQKVGTEAKPRSRYSELRQMLEERRRELHAAVQGKIRDVRNEGTWGGKQNEVFGLFLENLRTTMEKSGKIKVNQKELQALTKQPTPEGE